VWLWPQSCFAPGGCKEKTNTMKRALIKFRCSIYEKKLLQVKAKAAGTSLSAFCRNSLMEQQITQRMNEEHISTYKMLVKYHNNFKRIGNMYKKGNPKLSEEAIFVAEEIKKHLKTILK
tara:strand:- start:140 stop:496 length:357 start_codon:yes stop_codon:yes gene_type:complete